jgi:hypothetical protein
MAITELAEAIRRNPRCKQTVTALAAAYAKSGHFDKAAEHQTRFLEFPDLTDEEATEGRRCLALYEAGVSVKD